MQTTKLQKRNVLFSALLVLVVAITSIIPANAKTSDVFQETVKLKSSPEKFEIQTELVPQELIDKKADEELGKAIAELCDDYLGIKYTVGGSSPKTGFDCSGFVHFIYNKAGVCSEYYSVSGLYKEVEIVTEPIAGDIVFLSGTDGSTKITHVGIYIGDGYMIHSGSRGVSKDTVFSKYWEQKIVAFGRLR